MKRIFSLLFWLLLPSLALAVSPNSFRINSESYGIYTSGVRVAPTYIDTRVLASNVAESHTVPTGARFVIFSSSCAAFYANPTTTAAVPAADITNGTGSSLNPSSWFVGDVTTISLISPTSCIVTMEFFS